MKVVIYGKPGCKYCNDAKQICESNGIDYQYSTVGVDISKDQLLEKVGNPITTVPQIFIVEDGLHEYVGGYDQLEMRLLSI